MNELWRLIPASPYGAFDAAALRQRNANHPDGGRREGRFTRGVERLLPHYVGGLLGHIAEPGRVYSQGMSDLDEAVRWAAPTAFSMLGLSRLPGAAPTHNTSVVRRNNGDDRAIQEFPNTLQRPIDWDYPNGVPTDKLGWITHDIEGRPLVAKYVAGRRGSGGPDQPLKPAQIEDVIERLSGNPPEFVNPWQLPKGADGVHVTAPDSRFTSGADGFARRVAINNQLLPHFSDRVLAHETGHLISGLAGPQSRASRPDGAIPHKGLERELKGLYDVGHNPWIASGHPNPPTVTTEHMGYSKRDAPFEWMAEAIRAYLTNPNYIKTVAPLTAKRIREYVNAHPEWSKIIQFNSVGGLAALGALKEENEQEPAQAMSLYP